MLEYDVHIYWPMHNRTLHIINSIADKYSNQCKYTLNVYIEPLMFHEMETLK